MAYSEGTIFLKLLKFVIFPALHQLLNYVNL